MSDLGAPEAKDEICAWCNGSGVVGHDECDSCGGRGMIFKELKNAEIPAPKVGQSICEHGNPDPLTCKKCQAVPQGEFPPRLLAAQIADGSGEWAAFSGLAPPDYAAFEYLSKREADFLIAEARRQGMLDFSAILRNEAHEASPEVARFINKMALSIESEMEPKARSTPVKGENNG